MIVLGHLQAINVLKMNNMLVPHNFWELAFKKRAQDLRRGTPSLIFQIVHSSNGKIFHAGLKIQTSSAISLNSLSQVVVTTSHLTSRVSLVLHFV